MNHGDIVKKKGKQGQRERKFALAFQPTVNAFIDEAPDQDWHYHLLFDRMRPAIFICMMLLAVNGKLQYQPPQLSVNTGSSQYVTYYEGSLPLILAAPHGGRLFPNSIPDRTPAKGTITVTDAYTRDVVLGLARKIHERTGAMPHVVLLQIARTKVDVNRDKSDGADSDAGRMVWQVG